MRFIIQTHQDAPLYLAALYQNPRQTCLFTPFIEDACSYTDKNAVLDATRKLKALFYIDALILESSEK